MGLIELDHFISRAYDITSIENVLKYLNGDEVEDARINRLTEIKDKMERDLAQISKCIEQAKTLKFKKGDVVYHKEHGPIVIREIFVNTESWTMVERPFVFYYKGFSAKGEVTIEASEVIPYTDTTKILYANDKTD